MLSIRAATIRDVSLLHRMIRELAEFERESHLCVIEEADLERDGFGNDPLFRALIAEWDSQPAGYAIFFDCYSTWIGPELYLEDLFVRPEFRGKGIGTAMLAEVARIALQQGRRAMRWEVLDWNTHAIALYRELGAEFRDPWKSVLLGNDALRRLAEGKKNL
ncbi:MAG TPA: GNAT family N-acetyltransferase [Candidatus Aquilonibacter sp.]|nr:GNAT family N-acetyltransferase [Candidatus Aquilonibacter sp.]